MKKNNYIYLLWVFAKTDFKMRYQGSVLGYLWTLLKPLSMFAVLYLVFSVFTNTSIPHYQIYLLTGIITWNFFAEATTAGLTSLLAKSSIIKKVAFPRVLVIIASTLTALLTFLLNLCVLFIIYLLSGLEIHSVILLLPIYIGILYLLIIGISMILSVLQVRYRDTIQIWEVLLQAGFFLCPIVYALNTIPQKYLTYYFLNPMTGIIQYFRIILIDRQVPTLAGTGYLLILTISIFVVSLFVYKKLSKNMIENL